MNSKGASSVDTHILPQTSPRPHPKLHDIPIHQARIPLDPPLRAELVRVVPEHAFIEMDDARVDADPRAPWNVVSAHLASRRWCVPREGDAGDWVHPDALFNAGGQVGEFDGFVVRDVRGAELIRGGSGVDLRGEFFVYGSVAEDFV